MMGTGISKIPVARIPLPRLLIHFLKIYGEGLELAMQSIAQGHGLVRRQLIAQR